MKMLRRDNARNRVSSCANCTLEMQTTAIPVANATTNATNGLKNRCLLILLAGLSPRHIEVSSFVERVLVYERILNRGEVEGVVQFAHLVPGLLITGTSGSIFLIRKQTN